ncbi:MAG: dihydroorotate dehydrogenase electron transfer subunit [Thermogutta sp.]
MNCPNSTHSHPCDRSHERNDIWSGSAEVSQHERIAKDTFRIRLKCPEIARRIVPGQFVMMRLPGRQDPLLGRPLAMYDVAISAEDGLPGELDIVYITLGRMTRILATLRPGDAIEIWGPLGNGFAPCQAPHLILVSGGIGYTPFLAVAKEALNRQHYGRSAREPRVQDVVLCHGVRTADYLPDLNPFSDAGVEVLVSSEDGTVGQKGLVIAMLPDVLNRYRRDSACVYSCGPEPMLRAVADICARHGVPCFVSLETPMACGLGICFSCVVRLRERQGDSGEGWDYHRVCVEGPVFDASRVIFE